MFGGVGMQPQIDKLRSGVDILVATPGPPARPPRPAHASTCRSVEIFVLDEADRMLDMGFIHDIKKVLALLPQKQQSLLFSATFCDEIKALADRLLNKPVLIEVAPRNQTAELIAQKVHPVGREMKKRDLLVHLIKDNDWNQVLVFTRTKHGANRLVEQLRSDGITAMAIHGNKSQTARTQALADFKSGDLQVLVATDIAARGIDIDQLPHVVNFELPNVPEDYVHRIGRTGRAGTKGEAISLVCVDENGFLRDIERLIKNEIPKEIVPGFEPPAHERPEPIVLGRMVIGEGAGRGGARPRTRRPRCRARRRRSRRLRWRARPCGRRQRLRSIGQQRQRSPQRPVGSVVDVDPSRRAEAIASAGRENPSRPRLPPHGGEPAPSRRASSASARAPPCRATSTPPVVAAVRPTSRCRGGSRAEASGSCATGRGRRPRARRSPARRHACSRGSGSVAASDSTSPKLATSVASSTSGRSVRRPGVSMMQAPPGQQVQRARRRRVLAAAVVAPHRPGVLDRGAEQRVGQRRLAGSRRAEQHQRPAAAA